MNTILEGLTLQAREELARSLIVSLALDLEEDLELARSLIVSLALDLEEDLEEDFEDGFEEGLEAPKAPETPKDPETPKAPETPKTPEAVFPLYLTTTISAYVPVSAEAETFDAAQMSYFAPLTPPPSAPSSTTLPTTKAPEL